MRVTAKPTAHSTHHLTHPKPRSFRRVSTVVAQEENCDSTQSDSPWDPCVASHMPTSYRELEQLLKHQSYGISPRLPPLYRVPVWLLRSKYTIRLSEELTSASPSSALHQLYQTVFKTKRHLRLMLWRYLRVFQPPTYTMPVIQFVYFMDTRINTIHLGLSLCVNTFQLKPRPWSRILLLPCSRLNEFLDKPNGLCWLFLFLVVTTWISPNLQVLIPSLQRIPPITEVISVFRR